MNLFGGSLKRWQVLCCLVMGADLWGCLAVHAQTYPSRQIRMIVPWPAGGLVDVAARQLSQRLQVAMGQAIVIDNKLGAGGTIGADQASKAVADGNTLLLASSALTINAALGGKIPFDAVKDLEPVAVVAYARGCPEFCVNGVSVNWLASFPRIEW